MSNVCEDSLLASPLIIDLVVIAELMTRIQWKLHSADSSESTGEKYKSFHSVLSVLSYMLKAPLTPPGTPVVNALAKQRAALANIAAINGRGGQDPNESGGVFSISNQTFSKADLKFRGWNPNFKRRWLTAVTVERGSDPDIETAIVKKMIELIRKEKTGDFEWDSHRLNKVVTLSARPQDTQELMNFLYKEMFPEYRPPRG